MGRFLNTLRSRLILLAVLSAIPGSLFLTQTALEQRQREMHSVESEVIHLSNLASSTQELMVESVEAFLLTLSHLPTLQQQNMSECQEILSHLVEDHFKYYASFYVANLQGQILCSPPGMHAPPDFDQCEHYQELLGASDFVLSGYHICRHSGLAVFSIGLPVFNDQGDRILLTNVSLDLAWFYDLAAGSNLPDGSELLVLDEQGVILAHYPDNDLWRGQPLPENSALPLLFTQEQGVLIGTGLRGEETLFAISPMETIPSKKMFVVLGSPTHLAFAAADSSLRRNFFCFLWWLQV